MLKNVYQYIGHHITTFASSVTCLTQHYCIRSGNGETNQFGAFFFNASSYFPTIYFTYRNPTENIGKGRQFVT